MEGRLPTPPVPYLWGDFNACGWAGNGDKSLYALDREALALLPPADGMRVFVFEGDEDGTIFGCVATLRYVEIGAFSGWRAEPVPGTFYRGPAPEHLR